MTQTADVTAGHVLVLERRFQATPTAVYAAFTEPDKLSRWLGPGNMIVEEAIAELRVGGRFRVAMRDPDTGSPHVTNGVYQEIVPGRRLVHTWQWEGSDDETLVSVDITPEADGGTHLKLTHARFPDAGIRDQHEGGWSACLAKLDWLAAR